MDKYGSCIIKLSENDSPTDERFYYYCLRYVFDTHASTILKLYPDVNIKVICRNTVHIINQNRGHLCYNFIETIVHLIDDVEFDRDIIFSYSLDYGRLIGSRALDAIIYSDVDFMMKRKAIIHALGRDRDLSKKAANMMVFELNQKKLDVIIKEKNFSWFDMYLTLDAHDYGFIVDPQKKWRVKNKCI